MRWALGCFAEVGRDGVVVGEMLLLIANVLLVPCRFQLACSVDDEEVCDRIQSSDNLLGMVRMAHLECLEMVPHKSKLMFARRAYCIVNAALNLALPCSCTSASQNTEP